MNKGSGFLAALFLSATLLTAGAMTFVVSQKAHAEEQVTKVTDAAAAQVADQTSEASDLGLGIKDPSAEEWTGLFAQIGTLKGAGTAAIALAVLQLLLLLARSSFIALSATAKWWAVGVLSCLVALGVEIVKTPVFSWQVLVQAILSAPFIAAFSIMLHQGVKLNVNEKA